MRPSTLSYTPADDNTSGYASSITGAGPFTMPTTSAGDGLAHQTSITSTANLSGITFTITGTDADGIAQTEAIVGPNANTVYGSRYFRTVTTVSVSSSLGSNTASIGWRDTCVSPTIPLNWRQTDFQVSLGVDVSGTINYTVQHCLEDIRSAAPSTLTWFNHSSLNNQTADQDGNYAFPVSATRLLINSLTAGATVKFQYVQGN